MKATLLSTYLLLILLALKANIAYSQVPQGFTYQAVIRDGSGTPIANKTIGMRITLQNSLGTALYSETYSPTTNAQGVVSIIIGQGTPVDTSTFAHVPWKTGDVLINVEIDLNGGNVYAQMGVPSKIQSTPYALYAENTKEVVSKPNALDDDPIFEVKNKSGQVVFGVYQGGVRVYVEDTQIKGAKGGFAVGGLSNQAKIGQAEYFRITPDSARIWVKEVPLVKGAKGGFAVGGLSNQAKTVVSRNMMFLAPDSARIWVNDATKGAKGGFAVGGLSNLAKGANGQYLKLTHDNYFIGQGAGKSTTSGLYNTFLGYQNGYSNTKGSQNIFMGYQAGYMNDTASFNVFVGNEAGYNNLSGTYNTFIGFQSGKMNTSGDANVFIGQQAGSKIATGSANIFIGTLSGQNATNGSHNIFFGALAGSKNEANFNIFLGNYSGLNNVSGSNNLFAGIASGAMNRKGSSNIYLGLTAGWSDTVGSYNVFLGEGAGYNNQSSNNIMFGYRAGYLSTVGDYNLFMGNQSGFHNTGQSNLFFGWQSGWTNTSGSNNIFMGPLSGGYNSTGSDNTFIGTQAGYNGSTGNRNIAIGSQSGYNTNGVSNIFVGYQAGYTNTTGMQNTFMGTQAGLNNSIGYNNIFLGVAAGQSNTEGANNIFIGTQTGNKNTTGGFNTSIGLYAGFSNVSGSSNVFLGSQAGYYETGSNRLYIENSSADKNSALIYGEFDNKNLTINGNLGIGKTSPATKLDITGGNWNVSGGEGDFRIGDGNYRFKIGVANSGGGAGDVRMTAQGGTNRLILGGGGVDILLVTSTNVVPWTDNFSSLGASTNRWTTIYATNGVINTSDARLKSNIMDLGYGLETILKLHPVSFTWKDDSKKTLRLGLIAQDVQKVIEEVVDMGTDAAKTLGINYSEIVPVLIKGMQEQQKQIEDLKEQNKEIVALKAELEAIKALLKK